MAGPMATDALADGPLTGLRAIEFGQLLAGPFVGTLLGDFGADVIKVEAPPAGDPMREWGRLRHNDHSLWWSVLCAQQALRRAQPARGARPGDRRASCARPQTSSSRTSARARWSAGTSARSRCTRVNPGCIYARVSGYGQSGSYRDRAGFAAGGEAIAGLRYINGYPDQAPPRTGISLGDTLAAQSAFQGILMALYARDARGATGQVVDAAIADACFAMTESLTVEYDKVGFVREPTGPLLPKIAPSNVYRSSDGKWVVIAANHDTLWKRLAALMGHEEWGDDPRFADHAARGEHQVLLDEMIGEWALQHTAAELDEIVNAAGVVCAPVYTAADIHADPWFRERGLVVEWEDDVHGTIAGNGVVPKLMGTPGSVRQSARWKVGADNDDVLGELGLSAEEIAELRETGIA